MSYDVIECKRFKKTSMPSQSLGQNGVIEMTGQIAFNTEVISLEKAHGLVIVSDTPKGMPITR